MAFAPQSLWDVLVLFGLVMAIAPWFGNYVGRVFLDRPLVGDTILLPVESAIYRLLGTSPRKSMRPNEYMLAVLSVTVGTAAVLFFFFTMQASLPGDPTA